MSMPNRCSDYSMRGCPASYYLNCPAYAADKNCWEVAEEKPCCKEVRLTECRNCRLYLATTSPCEK